MTLGQKQRLFARLMSLLIEWAYQNGYEITFGDFYRDARAFGEVGQAPNFEPGYGRKASLHKLRLAGDLNLFRDGKYLTSTEDHRPLGEYWESLHELCSWGGHFDDGNHYSMQHQGMR